MLGRRKIVLIILLSLSSLFLFLLIWQQIKDGKSMSLTAQLLNLTQRQPVAIIDLNNERADINDALVGNSKPLSVTFCDFNINNKPLSNNLIINEIAWMGTPEDNLAEWIELKNISEKMLSVKNYQLIDRDNQIQINLPAIDLPAGGFLFLVRENVNQQLAVSADLIYKGALNNTNEILKLFDNHCVLIDAVSAEPNWPAGNNLTKQTMERTSSLSWQTSFAVGGTPKKENSRIVQSETKEVKEATIKKEKEEGVSKEVLKTEQTIPDDDSNLALNQSNNQNQIPPVVTQNQTNNILISEIMAGRADNKDYEYIELYNTSDQPVNLTGWELRKKNSAGNESNLVDNSQFIGIIPAHGYFLIASPSYNGSPSADLIYSVASANIAYTNNAVLLYNGDHISAQLIEEVKWTEIPKNQSWARKNWVTDEFLVQAVPTPQNSKSF